MKSLDMTKYVAFGYQLDTISHALDAVCVLNNALEAKDSQLASVLSLAFISACNQLDAIREVVSE